MQHARIAPWLLLPCVAVFAILAWPWRDASAHVRPEGSEAAEAAAPSPAAAPDAATQPIASPSTAPAQVDPAPGAAAASADRARDAAAGARPVLGSMSYDGQRRRYVAPYGERRAVLTVSPQLQQGLEKLLASYRVPVGAAVLLEPRTGRVLAMAEHVERGASGHVALRPIAPAASVFKIVTAAALLDRGIAPDAEVCFHGGNHRIQKALLSDDPRRDRRCLTLADALGKSANVVFAKLAGRALSPEQLRSEASRFLFNAPIAFEWPVEPSPARIPDDRFELATTAAGFGPVRMSPLHGAVLASLVANRGAFVPPRIVEEIDGVPVARGDARQVLRPEIAAAVARMMQTTVTDGTARKVFRRERSARGSPLREIAVAGKTGSLAEASPYRDYSWFVGFAPANDPQIAVAAVVVNERRWRVKAPFVAREALKAYFADASSRRIRTAALAPALLRARGGGVD